MKSWILNSFIATFFCSGWIIFTKLGTSSIPHTTLLYYYTVVCLILSILFNSIFKIKYKLDIFSLLTGFFTSMGIYFITLATKLADNPGLPDAIYSSQSILTFILSLIVFNGIFKLHKLLGIVITVISIFIIKASKTSHNIWLPYSIIAGIFASIQDILKKLLMNRNRSLYTLFFNVVLSQVIVFSIIHYYKNNKFIELITIKESYTVIITGILYYLFSYFLLKAISSASNVGYIKSILSFNIVLTTIMYELFTKVIISPRTWIGLLLNITGIYFIIN